MIGDFLFIALSILALVVGYSSVVDGRSDDKEIEKLIKKQKKDENGN